MSEAKHTPGPWDANVEGDGDVFAGDLQIADCDFPQGELSRETIRANADLAAAAPDMLALWELWLDEDNPFVTDTHQCECGPNANGYDDAGQPCIHILAHRAVAKARGEDGQ